VRSSAEAARAAVEQVARGGHGRLVAALTRRFGPGQLDRVEQSAQDAMVRALERWPAEGVPDDPERWLVRVAHNLTVDALRREGPPASELDEDRERAADAPPSIDDELALMFLCCHPSLSRAGQIALTLKTACGFTAPQIALALLADERTVAQRIVRAKQRLRQENAVFAVPGPDELPERLGVLLEVLYLVFNEGYSPSDGESAIKDELCAEALRLSRLFTDEPRTATPAAEALRALFCFQASRAQARRADDGSLLLLAEQDRARWDRALVEEALVHLDRAASGTELTRFHLEAGIAACHATAPGHQGTDWPQIVRLYDALRACAPSPVVEVNRAVAVAMTTGARAGIDELDAIPERDLLGRYPYALAAYAELHASLGDFEQARAYLERALRHQPSGAQRALLTRKLRSLG
jgi:RNA polymerase sigma-70 factor (ECF subfamily)